MAVPLSILTPIAKLLEKTLASSLLGSNPLDQSFLVFLATVLTLLLISWVTGHVVKHRLRNDPPGPMPLPFFGNLFCFGTSPHVSLANLRQRYGPVIKLRIGWRSFVVINSIEVMREALNRRTHDFDGRADSFVGNMISYGGNDLVFASYGDKWKLHRQLCARGLSEVPGNRLSNLEAVVAKENSNLVKRILKHGGRPFDPQMDISLAVLNIICQIAFGTRFSEGDPELKKNLQYINIIASSFDIVGNAIDCFPFLRLFPFGRIKNLKDAMKVRDEIMSEQLKRHQENGLKAHDFTTFLLNSNETGTSERKTLSDTQLKLLMFDVFGAGVDTTIVALLWAIVYLIRWPECQRKIQAEVDKLKPERSAVTVADKKDFHYTQAAVYETLRMCSLFPIAPRKATRNTTLEGYDIPKGTDVCFNLWGINHDDRHWKNPEVFMPERFLKSDGKLKTLRHLSFAPFSIGRRRCPGENIARNEIFLILCTLMQHFDMKPINELPSLDSVPTVSVKPKPFKCIFLVREKN